MILSFINYEIRVNLEKKSGQEVGEEDKMIKEKAAHFVENANFAKTMAANPAELNVEHEDEPHHVDQEDAHQDPEDAIEQQSRHEDGIGYEEEQKPQEAAA